MSVQRSPTKTNSQPDLSRMRDDDFLNIAVRKRKTPDCHCNQQELMDDFYNKMMTSFTAALDSQNNNIKSVLDGIREDFNSLRKQISGVNSTIEKMAVEQANLKKDVCELSSTTGLITQRVDLMSSEIAQLQSITSDFSDQLKAKEQLGRINNVEISGIPLLKSENLNNIIYNIAKKVGFTLLPTDIDYIHRVRRFNSTRNDIPTKHDGSTPTDSSSIPNIIVRFSQRYRKNELLAAVRARRGLTTADAGLNGPTSSVYVSDHLAPHNKLLYKQTRILAKQKEYKYVWLSDCKILLRKNDTSRVQLISCDADLSKIK